MPDPVGTPPVPDAAPTSGTGRRVRAWVFPVAFVALAALSLLIYTLVSPLVRGTTVEIDASSWGHADRERFVSAVMLWGSFALGACVSALVLLGLAWREVASTRRGLALGGGVAAVAAVIYFMDPGASYLHRLDLHTHGLLAFDLAQLTQWFNALTGATLASLFAAGAVIVARLEAEPTPERAADAADRFRALLMAGAAATVLGVLSIGAVHRLAGAASSAPGISDADRARVTRVLHASLTDPAEAGAAHPGLEVVSRWVADRAGISVEDAKPLAERMRAPAADDPDFYAWFFAQQAEPRRAELVKSLDGIATAVASWWGVVFTISLVLVYVLGVAAIAPVGELKGAKAISLTDQAGTSARWAVLIRVATALAPILAAGLAEAIQKILALFAGE